MSCLAPEEAAIFSDSRQVAANALDEARAISHLLHPPLLDEMGLSFALGWYVDGFPKRSGIET